MTDEVCSRCGGPTKGTFVHPTAKPFHVPCTHDPDKRRCYVDCDDCRAEAEAEIERIKERRAARQEG